MNWQVKVSGLIMVSALVSFVLGGCEKYDLTIGFPPDNPLAKSSYFELTPEYHQILRDSVYNNEAPVLFSGQFMDPVFGKTYSHAMFEFTGSGTKYDTIYIDDAIDSTTFTLIHNSTYGINPSSLQAFDIYKLNKGYTDEQREETYTFTDLASSKYITSFSLNLDLNKGLDEKDTITMNLDNALFEEVFDSLKNPTKWDRYYQSGIRHILPGYKIVPDVANDGIIGLEGDRGSIKLNIYYSSPGDTVSKVITIINSQERHNYLTPNKLVPDRTGSALEGYNTFNTPFTTTDQKAYMQSPTGLELVIKFSSLAAVLDTLDHLVVTNAILEANNVQSVNDSLTIPNALQFYLTDETNETILNRFNIIRKVYGGMNSDSLSSSKISGAVQIYPVVFRYSEIENSYQADISLYLQSIIESQNDLPNIILKEVTNNNKLNQLHFDQQDLKLRVFYSTRAIN